MLEFIECVEKIDKFEQSTHQINDDITRQDSFTGENTVLLQLLKKNNIENDDEAIKK